MQDLQSCLGLGKARCRCKVWRNHYEHAGDIAECCRKRIHVVVVGFEELRTWLLPLCRFLGIPYDSSNLLALCKKRAHNGAAYLPCDSHDCVHIDGSWFLSWLSEMICCECQCFSDRSFKLFSQSYFPPCLDVACR